MENGSFSAVFDVESYSQRQRAAVSNGDAGILRDPSSKGPIGPGKSPSQIVLAMHRLEEALSGTSSAIDELEQRVVSVSCPRPPQANAVGGGATQPRVPTAPLAEAVEMMALQAQNLTRRLADVIMGLEV